MTQNGSEVRSKHHLINTIDTNHLAEKEGVMDRLKLEIADIPHLEKQADIANGWKISHNFNKDGSEPKFWAHSTLVGLTPCLALEMQENIRWLRIEKVLTADILKSGTIRVKIRYACESPNVGPNTPCGRLAIFKQEKNGHCTMFKQIPDKLKTSNTISEIDGIISFDANDISGHPILIAAHLDIVGSYRIFDFSVESSTNEDFYKVSSDAISKSVPQSISDISPFRYADFTISSSLRELNDNMDRDLRSKPVAWLGDMLNIALKLEDYDVALGLCNYIIQTRCLKANDAQGIFENICKVYNAVGDMESLIDAGIDIACNYPPAIKGKIIKSVSKYTTSDTDDLYTVNKMIEDPEINVSGQSIINVSNNLPNSKLLVANYYRESNPDKYNYYINDFLKSTGSRFSAVISEGKGNVLDRVKFVESNASYDDVVSLSYNPLVSVIVAAYNCGTTLHYAVTSIINQTYKNIEVLIVDDCSSDDTKKVMKNLKNADSRIRIFSSNGNQGPYNIRNGVIAEARGELITIHDSDDFALPDRIENQVRKMISAGTFVSLSQWVRLTPEGHFVAFSDGEFLRMCVNSIMFHRQVFTMFGPYRSVMFGADSEFYEYVRGHLGRDKISNVSGVGVLGLWSNSSLTKTPGIEANERGYRAPKRRIYSGLAGRQRVLGKNIITDVDVNKVLTSAGIFREPSLISEILGEI